MNNETKQLIADALKVYIDTHSITQTNVANRADVRKEYITAILKGVFTYDSGKGVTGDIPRVHFIKIADLIEFEIVKRIWKNRATPQLTQTIAILEEAREHAYTRLIIGITGSGKSHAKNLYMKQHPADVFSVTVGSEDTLNILLSKVCDSLRIEKRAHKSLKIRDISMTLCKLQLRGLKPQLIFDEAEYLKVSALCSIKEFYDYLDEYCSIVLIGTAQLTNQIDKLRKKDAKGIPQLYRRIKFGIRHLPTIDKSFKLFLNEIKDKEVLNFLRYECDNYGELHDVLVPCIRESERLDVPLSMTLIKKVLNINNF